MSQSSLLVGLLAAMFIFYIAVHGRLGVYTATLWGDGGNAAGKGTSGGSGGSSGKSSSGPDLGSIVTTAADAAAILGF